MRAARFARKCLVLFGLIFGGCTALPNGRSWGEGVTLSPGWEQIRLSAVNAATDPSVWVPLLGAATVQIDNWDHRISDWARRETPIFGSQADAERWSDDLRSASVVAHFTTVLLTPSGDMTEEWLVDKAKGYGVQLLAATAAIETSSLLKNVTSRERPDGRDNQSFPSGHATTSAAYSRLAADNLSWLDLSHPTRVMLAGGLDALSIGTAWARVEAGAHFPSDTLFGMALGNFSAAFFNAAFLGQDSANAALAFVPQPGGGELRWQLRFGGP